MAKNNSNASEDGSDGDRIETHYLFMDHTNSKIHPSVAVMIADVERRRHG